MIISRIDFLFFCLFLGTFISAFYIIMYYWDKSKHDGLLYSFTVVQICIMIWTLGVLIEIFLIPNGIFYWVNLKVYFSGICFIGVWWLIFCLKYTNSRFIGNRKNVILLLVPPVIFYLFVLTNDFHLAFFNQTKSTGRSYGLVFWMHSAFSYTYILIGTTKILLYAIKKYGFSRIRSILLALANLIPTVVSGVTIALQPRIDVTPCTFLFSSTMLSIAMLKYRLFSIIPISAISLLNSMRDGVVIINNYNIIESINDSLVNNFRSISLVKQGDSADDFFSRIEKSIVKDEETEGILLKLKTGTSEIVSGYIEQVEENGKHFLLSVLPVKQRLRQNPMGRIGVFTDISEHIRLNMDLKNKNMELQKYNEKLVEQTLKIEELSVLNERGRITKDIHDSVGSTFTLLISLFGAMRITLKEEPDQIEKRITTAFEVTQKGLVNLRNSLRGLQDSTLTSDGLINALKKLFEDFENSGLSVEFSVEGEQRMLGYTMRQIVYRTCQEGLTNSVKHGKADKVSVLLCFEERKISLFIFDNGVGCNTFRKGIGLASMEERIRNIGGTISLGSTGDVGFNIHIDIPYEEEEK